jgi:hypothetical protein
MRRILERLGQDATYTPTGGGGSSTVRGLFLQPYQEVAGIVGSSDPSFACMLADVETIKGGATFLIGVVTWRVKPSPEKDPVSGVVVARLERQ